MVTQARCWPARSSNFVAADAAAGLPLADRLRAWPRIAQADAGVHDQVLAAHLAAPAVR
ncbi:hypothetical protein [Streptomyces misionensis]|uniref:hypothetical protein n=1 Tax=Streptomyces misionensis TaxID=67331 RepID=UPI0036774667